MMCTCLLCEGKRGCSWAEKPALDVFVEMCEVFYTIGMYVRGPEDIDGV